MHILVSIGTVGASPQIGEILPLCDFLDCPVLTFFFSFLRPGRTDFHALWLKRRVFAQGSAFWGLERWVTTFGGNRPHKTPQKGWNRQFQAKTPK